MDYRTDVLPPVLALALSLSLHVGVTQLRLRLPDRAEDLDLTPVTMEYLPPQEARGSPSGQTPGQEAAPEQAPPPSAAAEEATPSGAREEPAPPEQTPQPAPPPPPRAARPSPPIPAAPAPPVVPAPPQSSAPPEVPPPAVASSPSEGPPGAVQAPPPEAAAPRALQDLLPRPNDLRSYAQAETTPDPTGEEAQEVTLTLGNTDVRYRGYLNQVQASIDRSWRWREALLAAGTAGQVLVRFSLGPDGQVEDVGVVESSGSPVLDREAADAVKRAPIPEFPRHWRLQRLNLFAQFAYRME